MMRTFLATVLLAIPLVAAAMPTFPVTIDGNIQNFGPFTSTFFANGTMNAFGATGTWSYDPATRILEVDIPGALQATGRRQGRCFRGRANSPLVPTGTTTWRGCVTP